MFQSGQRDIPIVEEMVSVCCFENRSGTTHYNAMTGLTTDELDLCISNPGTK